LEILKEFLSAFWLRPEVALIKTHEYLALQQFALDEPSADVGCGDGIFSFIAAGGRFGPGFDMYQNVAFTERFFQGVDVFDHFDPERFRMEITAYPTRQITYGIDHKATLLEKAKPLRLYQNTIVADANHGIPLPENSLRTVFCNIIYILENLDRLLAEMRRVLQDGGRIVLQLPEKRAEEVMIYHLHAKHGWEWARLIDRNKYATTYPAYHRHERSYWDEKIRVAGLKVVQEVDLRPDLVHVMWDIGLRPLFPAFMEMYRRLAPTDRGEVKRVWVDTLAEVLAQFCEPKWMYTDLGCKPTYRMVALEKA